MRLFATQPYQRNPALPRRATPRHSAPPLSNQYTIWNSKQQRLDTIVASRCATLRHAAAEDTDTSTVGGGGAEGEVRADRRGVARTQLIPAGEMR